MLPALVAEVPRFKRTIDPTPMATCEPIKRARRCLSEESDDSFDSVAPPVKLLSNMCFHSEEDSQSTAGQSSTSSDPHFPASTMSTCSTSLPKPVRRADSSSSERSGMIVSSPSRGTPDNQDSGSDCDEEPRFGTYVRLSEFASHVASGQAHLEFDRINSMTSKKDFLATCGGVKVGLETANAGQNRHPIPPFSNNRVVLSLATRESDDSLAPVNNTYINASPLTNALTTDPTCTHIATQAPLPHTIPKFWEMILQNEVHTVVALAPLKPGQCDQYWPSRTGENVQYSFDDSEDCVQVLMTSEEQLPAGIIRRTFETQILRGGNVEPYEPHHVCQFHLPSWEDHTAPEDLASILYLLDAVEERRLKHGPSPIIVHCSAGVGRAGTFIAADQACTIARARFGQGLGRPNLPDEGFNLSALVYQLRHQRPLLVYKPQQFVALYSILYRFCTGETLFNSTL
jgi:protein tyrosine phosphatase